MRNKLDTVFAGIATALLGLVVGYVILGGFWGIQNGLCLSDFTETFISNSKLYRDSILTVCILLNIGVFYFALRKEMWKFCRGMMLVIMLSVPVIVWLQLEAGIA